LKDYKKRQLFTMGNMSTERSMSNIHQEELQNMQNRFDYDQHTDSIALLFEGKNESGHPTVRNKISEVEVKLSGS
jgi:N-formylglutamate amidohydrolase